jgi:pyruvate carboxylase
VQANRLLGDIVKVTPTSKVVGDLAQFLVSNKLSYDDVCPFYNIADRQVIERAEELDFPASVLDFFEGLMGQPYGGFPEPLRTKVLRGRRTKLTERPGKSLKPLDLHQIRLDIEQKFGSADETDVASYTQYPKVYEEFRSVVEKFGDLSVLPTRYFLSKPEISEEFAVELEKGKVLIVKLLAVGPVSEKTGQREVFFEMNGEVRSITVDDKHAGKCSRTVV